MVYDFMGGYKPKSVMWAEEQRMLCETLLLAIKVYSRVTVNSIMDLFGLMMELHQRIHETSRQKIMLVKTPYKSDGAPSIIWLLL